MTPDVIDQIDLTLDYGEGADIAVKVWQDAGKNTPFDLTTATVGASSGRAGRLVLVPFAVTAVAPNEVALNLTIDEVNALPPSCWWSLVVSTAGGRRRSPRARSPCRAR